MTTGVHFNPSTLKVAYNNATNKVMISSYEYGVDCCQFLDPDTPDWSSIVTYSLGNIVESHIIEGTYRSKADNNLNHAVSDTNWWTKISDEASCGCTDWNTLSGYGGVGKSPNIAIIRFANVGEVVDECAWAGPYNPNRRFVLERGYWGLIVDGQWGCSTEDDKPYYCVLTLSRYGPEQFFLAHVELWSYDPDGDEKCWIFDDQITDLCGGAVHGTTFEFNGATAYVTFGPPNYYLWAWNADYIVGDMITGSANNIYACKLNHTATIDDHPTTGINWATYWHIAEWCV